MSLDTVGVIKRKIFIFIFHIKEGSSMKRKNKDSFELINNKFTKIEHPKSFLRKVSEVHVLQVNKIHMTSI